MQEIWKFWLNLAKDFVKIEPPELQKNNCLLRVTMKALKKNGRQ
jgi:hypothetical protein